jgi:hypothetical protein
LLLVVGMTRLAAKSDSRYVIYACSPVNGRSLEERRSILGMLSLLAKLGAPS